MTFSSCSGDEACSKQVEVGASVHLAFGPGHRPVLRERPHQVRPEPSPVLVSIGFRLRGCGVPALPVRRSTRPSHRPAPAPPPGVRPMSRPRPLPSKRCCASACSRSPADTKMPSCRYIFPLTLTVLADVEWKVSTMRRVGINLRELRQIRRESSRLDYGNKSRRHFPHLVCLSILVIFPAYPK